MSGTPSFAPTRESLRQHRAPAWYQDAKLGIFIHWGLASVAGFAPRDLEISELLRTRYRDFLPLSPYTEWYENAIKFPWSPSAQHHRAVWGGRPYAEFRALFQAGLEAWQPERWAADFAAAGARYAVMVTKHHDGYSLWPSQVANPKRDAWASPRDCVGELAAATRAQGLRFGVYYSGGIDWSFNTKPVRDFGEFIGSIPRGEYPAYAEAQVRELIERYAPSVLWNDIAWPGPEDRLLQLFADYYTAVPEGLVNDRWMTPTWPVRAFRVPVLRMLLNRALERGSRRGKGGVTPPPPVHFDTRTPEYAVFPDIRSEKWESVRGMDKSFGYNRASRPEDFLSHEELIHSFVDIVSKNGNLLLNVGPRGEDGAIPEAQRQRLAWLGTWLQRNGEAIYATRPWTRAEGTTREGTPLRFTCRQDTLYAILLGSPPRSSLTLQDLPEQVGDEVRLLGHGPLRSRRQGADLHVELPALPESPAHALALALRPAAQNSRAGSGL